MAIVTGNYVTSAGTALPAGVVPKVEVIPSKAAVSAQGRIISQRPQEVTPDPTTGAFTLELVPTVDVPDSDFYYTVKGFYLDPHMYEPGKGGGRVDTFQHKIYVPTAGGMLGELMRTPLPILTWVLVDPAWSDTNLPQIIIPGFLYLSAHPTDPDLGTGQLWKAVP